MADADIKDFLDDDDDDDDDELFLWNGWPLKDGKSYFQPEFIVSQISDTPQAQFETTQCLGLGLIEWHEVEQGW